MLAGRADGPPAADRGGRWRGLVLRLAFGLLYWTGKPLTHDEQEYLSLARSLTAGQGFVYDAALESGTGAQFGRAPGYPAFLAAIGAGSDGLRDRTGPGEGRAGVPRRGGRVADRRLGPAAVGRRRGRGRSGDRRLYPPLVWMPAYVLSEACIRCWRSAAAYSLRLAADARESRLGAPPRRCGRC